VWDYNFRNEYESEHCTTEYPCACVTGFHWISQTSAPVQFPLKRPNLAVFWKRPTHDSFSGHLIYCWCLEYGHCRHTYRVTITSLLSTTYVKCCCRHVVVIKYAMQAWKTTRVLPCLPTVVPCNCKNNPETYAVHYIVV